ncbi:probable pectin methyltransferase QUA3 [Phragmites australis]|uniref:probable pectin methyltransferase QUA3 n=1 Tax=Phragmites australis TaxID=29695 RepID=UPI002D777365|nr:probable pectin methyltransferase QUA3 [Phragmites australis]
MGLLNSLPPHRRGALSGGWQWSFLDVVWAVFLLAVVVFLALVFTPHRGDPLAAASVRAGGAVPPCAASEVDLLPCEDPRRSSRLSREMNYYRERHCPARGEAPACLVPPPRGYRVPVPWPESLHKIWHDNMPYGKIAERKGHQGWMKHEGSYFIFPGGGTMFPDGAEQYIEKLTQYVPLKTGVLRIGLDMGCGVASFGGFLLKENITTLSFAPRDSHKSQIQFALERGIPAFLLMLGTRRLPFPAQAFDFVHCSRCLIPFTAYNGTYFIEVDRLLRPGGYLIISGPPVRWKKQEKEWGELQAMAQALCYELITVDGNTAIWKKPAVASFLPKQNEFGLDFCSTDDDPDEAWYFKLKKCISKVSMVEEIAIGSIHRWPYRLSKPSARASLINNGASLFEVDNQKWARRISYYKKSLGVKLGTTHVRNVMDMNAFFGGFAATIVSDPVWVMNVVPAQKPLTLGVIYDRGLIGVYHDWCEPFSTYPRTYDLIHADGINSLISDPVSMNNRCDLFDVMLEMDRMLRPEGTAVIRGSPDVIGKASQVAQSIRWNVQVHDSEPESGSSEKILVATKTFWKLPLTPR